MELLCPIQVHREISKLPFALIFHSTGFKGPPPDRPTDRPGLRWATDNAISEEIKERSRPAFQLARVW